jgi:hypothetical protein
MTAPDESFAVTVARIEVKLDQALANHADHETRIRKLERALWIATGAAAAGGGTLGAIASQLMGA